MSFQLFQVDAFTNQPFSGNPAAVCLLPEPQETHWMQQVAAEMNLSETTDCLSSFATRRRDGRGADGRSCISPG